MQIQIGILSQFVCIEWNVYLVILSTENASNEFGVIAEMEWKRTKDIRSNVHLDYFVVMPNHIHGIVIIEKYDKRIVERRGVMHYAPTGKGLMSPAGNLGSIIRGYKSSVTKKINQLRNSLSEKIWQRNYYEHIIRNEIDLYNTRRYIKMNPLH